MAPRFKRRRAAASPGSPSAEVPQQVAEWAAEAVAHARAAMGRGAAGDAREAASLLAAVLLRLPALWAELAQDLVLAFGAWGAEARAGDAPESAPEPARPGRRLLLAGAAGALGSEAALAAEQPPAAAAAAVALLCMLGEAEMEERRYIVAFETLRRAQRLAQLAGSLAAQEHAAAAIEGLRTAALERWHFLMVNDTERGEQYGRAIAAAVEGLAAGCEASQTGGVVALDIGTGTGLLALMCARLPNVGAVHACEMNDVLAAVAQEVVAAQVSTAHDGRPLREVVRVQAAASTDVRLPRKVDLVFSEIFDAGLLGEHVLPTLFHARRELLREGGKVVPARATVFGLLVESPAALQRFQVSQPPAGVSFAGVQLRSREKYTCETLHSLPHQRLTEPVKLLHIDFTRLDLIQESLETWVDPPVQMRACCDGEAQALVFWWELELDEAGACRINSSPGEGCASWQQAVQPLGRSARRVRSGETLALRARVLLDGFDFALAGPLDSVPQAEAAPPEALPPEAAPQGMLLELGEDVFLRLNRASHWEAVQAAVAAAVEALESAGAASLEVLDLSEGPLPLALLFAARRCAGGGRTGRLALARALAGAGSEAAREGASVWLRGQLPPALADRVAVHVAAPLQLMQAALDDWTAFAEQSPAQAGSAKATNVPEGVLADVPADAPLSDTVAAPPGPSAQASLVLCEDLVHDSGALRPGALEDLSLFWRLGRGREGRLSVVPGALRLRLTLVESEPLLRRTRVVEAPGGLDIGSINALSVQEFMGFDEAELAPCRRLSEAAAALELPLASPRLPAALAALAGAGRVLVRLVATSAGCVHGVLAHYDWPSADGAPAAAPKLAGVAWPLEPRCLGARAAGAAGAAGATGPAPPLLSPGDAAVVAVSYAPSRGLLVSPIGVERAGA